MTRWVAMVQREVGERLAAAPGTAPTACRRCSPSSPATCACCAAVRAPSSTRCRTSTPCSSCSSAAARRRRPAAARARPGRRSPTGARRWPARWRCARAGATCATAPARRWTTLGHPADVRAERLSPEDFRALVARRCGDRRARRPARSTSACSSGRCAPDGRHELVTVFQPVTLADELALEPAPRRRATRSCCPGVEGPNLAADGARARSARATRLGRAAGAAARSTSACRSPAGMGGGSADAAAALRLAARRAALATTDLLRESPPGSAPTCPAQVAPGALPRDRRGRASSSRSTARRAATACSCCRAPEPLSTADVYRGPTGWASPRDAADLAERRRAVEAAGAGPARRPDRQRPRGRRARAVPGRRRRARGGARRRRRARARLRVGADRRRAVPQRRRRARRRGRLGDRTPRPVVAAPWRGPAARRRRREARLARRRRGAGRVPRRGAAASSSRRCIARRRDRRRRAGGLRHRRRPPAEPRDTLIKDVGEHARPVDLSARRRPRVPRDRRVHRPDRPGRDRDAARRPRRRPGADQRRRAHRRSCGSAPSRATSRATSSAAASAARSSSGTAARSRSPRRACTRSRAFFDRHGGKAILIGRFVGLVRAIAPFIAGLERRCRCGGSCPTTSSAPGCGARRSSCSATSSGRASHKLVDYAKKGALALGDGHRPRRRDRAGSSRWLRRPENRRQAREWLERAGRAAAAAAVRARPAAGRPQRAPARRGSSGTGVTPGDLGLELTTLAAVGGGRGVRVHRRTSSRSTPARPDRRRARRTTWPSSASRSPRSSTVAKVVTVLGGAAGRQRARARWRSSSCSRGATFAEALVARASAWR